VKVDKQRRRLFGVVTARHVGKPATFEAIELNAVINQGGQVPSCGVRRRQRFSDVFFGDASTQGGKEEQE
jgi:hypothetical protein